MTDREIARLFRAQFWGRMTRDEFVDALMADGVKPERLKRLSSGYPVSRKEGSGLIAKWAPETARLRLQLMPASYLELEKIASFAFDDYISGRDVAHDEER